MCFSLKEPDVCQSHWELLFHLASAKKTHKTHTDADTHTPTPCKQSQCVWSKQDPGSESSTYTAAVDWWTADASLRVSFSFLPQQPCLLFFSVSMKQTCNFHSCVLTPRQSESGKRRQSETSWLMAFRGLLAIEQHTLSCSLSPERHSFNQTGLFWQAWDNGFGGVWWRSPRVPPVWRPNPNDWSVVNRWANAHHLERRTTPPTTSNGNISFLNFVILFSFINQCYCSLFISASGFSHFLQNSNLHTYTAACTAHVCLPFFSWNNR